MYGTIFRMKAKLGREQKLIAVFHDWEKEQKPQTPGAIGGLLFKPDGKSDEFIGVAVFQDKESYAANADNPGQDAWYKELRELLVSAPIWEDGEYVAGSVALGQASISPPGYQ